MWKPRASTTVAGSPRRSWGDVRATCIPLPRVLELLLDRNIRRRLEPPLLCLRPRGGPLRRRLDLHRRRWRRSSGRSTVPGRRQWRRRRLRRPLHWQLLRGELLLLGQRWRRRRDVFRSTRWRLLPWCRRLLDRWLLLRRHRRRRPSLLGRLRLRWQGWRCQLRWCPKLPAWRRDRRRLRPWRRGRRCRRRWRCRRWLPRRRQWPCPRWCCTQPVRRRCGCRRISRWSPGRGRCWRR